LRHSVMRCMQLELFLFYYLISLKQCIVRFDFW
jgi:hypothetical protein